MSTHEATWQPAFLSPHQDETLTEYAELLLPRTDTPGARDVGVNRTIDRHLATAPPHVQQRFVASLTWIDEASRARFGTPFLDLPRWGRVEFFEHASCPGAGAAFAHFMHLKMWIAKAYYDSPPGMRELGWTVGPDSEP